MASGTSAHTHDQRINTLEIIGSGAHPIDGFIGNVTGDIFSTGESIFAGTVDFSEATVLGLTDIPVGDVSGNLIGNVLGDVTGNLNGVLFGKVYGDLCGNIDASLSIKTHRLEIIEDSQQSNVESHGIFGNLVGDVIGNLHAKYINTDILATNGKVHINETIDSSSPQTGSLVVDGGVGIAKELHIGSNVHANFFHGTIIGDQFGDLTGNLFGDVTGNLFGNVHGDVLGGNLHGNLFGTLYGDVIGGNLNGNLSGVFNGDVNGGNLIGTFYGDLVNGNLIGDTYVTGNLNILGSVHLGDTSSDLIVPNGLLNGSLIPSDDALFTLGNLSHRWNSLHLSDSLEVGGSVKLGSNNADQIELNGRITTNLEPNVTDQYDLGTNSLNWRNLYLSGDAQIAGQLNVTGNLHLNNDLILESSSRISGDLIPLLDNNDDLGSLTNRYNSLFLGGGLTVDNGPITLGTNLSNSISILAGIDSHLLPSGGNIIDLGSVGNPWKDLYLSGNSIVNGNVQIDNNLIINGQIDSNLIPDPTGNLDIGGVLNEWKSLYLVNGGGVYVNGTRVITNQQGPIGSLVDNTGGIVSNTLDALTTGGTPADIEPVENAIASLAAKLETVIQVLRNHGLITIV